MKGKLLLILMTLLLAIPAGAQKNVGQDNDAAKRKEFLDFKLKFLADEIELKADQKKQFDEVYTQMESERRAVFKKMKAAERTIKNNKNASEEDYVKASKEISAAKAEMTAIEQKYEKKFATFLSQKQIYKLKEAEKEFMEKARACRDKKKAKK